MSTLHEELAGVGNPACRLCSFLRDLPPAEAAEWRAELALPVGTIGNTAVMYALMRRGVDISETSVRRHRTRRHM